MKFRIVDTHIEMAYMPGQVINLSLEQCNEIMDNLPELSGKLFDKISSTWTTKDWENWLGTGHEKGKLE